MGKFLDALLAMASYTPQNKYREEDEVAQCNAYYMRDAIQNPTHFANDTINSFTRDVSDSIQEIGKTTDSILKDIFK